MYEKILVPLDGSEIAERSLPYAEELAGRLSSEIHVVTVEEYNMNQAHAHKPGSHLKGKAETIERNTQKYLSELLVKSDGVKTVVLIGHAAEGIVAHADKEDIDLIVMSTHGRTGIKRWALGSVADKTVRATRRPVMLIRATGAHPDVHEKSTFRRVLVPLDGSEESEVIVPYVKELGSKLEAEIILFQAVERAKHTYATDNMVVTHLPYSDEEMEPFKADAESYLNQVGNLLKGDGINLRSKVGIGEAAEWIIEYADEIDADLVAMATHGRSGISRWTLGSVASKVLHAGNTPLMLLRASENPVE